MGRKKHPEPLTPAEQRVLEEVRTGATNAEIAVRLRLSINTVKYHVANMLAKTGLGDRSELRDWKMPRDGGQNWWLRGAVAVGVVGAVAMVSLLILGGAEDPDREAWIAYPAGGRGNDKISMIEIQTGKKRELVAEDGWLFATVVWSPDGQWLAAGAVRTDSTGFELRIYDRESLQLRTAFDAVIEPYWSPDSSRIAIASEDRVVLASPDGAVLADEAVKLGTGSPKLAWNSTSSWLAVRTENDSTLWDRDGNPLEWDIKALDWPIPVTRVVPGWFIESGELLVVGEFETASGQRTGVHATLDLDAKRLTLLDSIPGTGDPLYEYATMTASRPELVLRPPEFSVEAKGRYYMTFPSPDWSPDDIMLIVVTGAGTFDVKTPEFTGTNRQEFSLVLVGDWPDPPPLSAPTSATPYPTP